MEEINEMETREVRYIIQCLNPKGDVRILTSSWNYKEKTLEYARTYQEHVTDSDVICKISAKKAYEVLADIRRVLEWEFSSEKNDNPRGWSAPTIRLLQGLHSFSITKSVREVKVHTGFFESPHLQLDCSKERKVS